MGSADYSAVLSKLTLTNSFGSFDSNWVTS